MSFRKHASVLVLNLMLAMPAVASSSPDSVIDGLARMLESGVSEDVALQWLDASSAPPRLPTADEIVVLKQAGATDVLLARVIELATRSEVSPPPAAPSLMPVPPPAIAPLPSTESSAGSTPSPVPPRPVAASDDRMAVPMTPRVAVRPSVADDEAGVSVLFRLRYAPDFGEDEDEWDLLVYLDGKPLSFVPTGSFITSKELRFTRDLAPGRHVLRVFQERHVRRFKGWFHAARVAEEIFVFDLAGDATAEVDVAFRQPTFAFRTVDGPLSYRFIQGERTVDQREVGSDPEAWPLLCEEIEANRKDDGKLAKRLERALKGCVRWASLWDRGAAETVAPNRTEVRESLEMFRYRPIPKGDF